MTREEVINWMNQTAVECGLKLEKEEAMRGLRYHLTQTYPDRFSWDRKRDVIWATFYEDNSMTLHHPNSFQFDKEGNLRNYERSYHAGFRDCKVENLTTLLQYRGEIDKSLGDIVRAKKKLKIAELYAEGHSGIK